MKRSDSRYFNKILLLPLLLFMAITAMAQNRLSPCSKQDYELYTPVLKELYNPNAAQQYIVVDGESEKYALQIIKGSLFSERKFILAFKDLNGNKKELTDSLCQTKISSLLRYAVLSSTPFVRKKLGFLKTCFFFDLQDGAECSLRKEDVKGANLIDVLETSCVGVKNNKPELIRQLIPQIDSLTQHFKSFELPGSWEIVTSGGYVYEKPYTSLSTHYNGLYVIFLQPDLTPNELSCKYGGLTQTIAKWLFMNTNIIDFNKSVKIYVFRDTLPSDKRFFRSDMNYNIGITLDELTEEKLRELFKLYILK